MACAHHHPVVISHAEGGWRQARSFRELLELDAELEVLVGKYIPNFELLIDDLALTDESELHARVLPEMALLALLLLKLVRSSNNLPDQLEAWFDTFQGVARAPNGLVTAARMPDCVLRVGDIETQTLVGIARRIESAREACGGGYAPPAPLRSHTARGRLNSLLGRTAHRARPSAASLCSVELVRRYLPTPRFH